MIEDAIQYSLREHGQAKQTPRRTWLGHRSFAHLEKSKQSHGQSFVHFTLQVMTRMEEYVEADSRAARLFRREREAPNNSPVPNRWSMLCDRDGRVHWPLGLRFATKKSRGILTTHPIYVKIVRFCYMSNSLCLTFAFLHRLLASSVKPVFRVISSWLRPILQRSLDTFTGLNGS